MVKRFLIAAIIVGLFLGGVGYFNLVFKPKMIGEFMAKMVPPPATVTAEAAKSERWTDRVRAIGTLVAIEGVDVAPQVGGTVTDYYFDSGHDVQKGDRLVKLDTSVEEADLADNKATLTRPFSISSGRSTSSKRARCRKPCSIRRSPSAIPPPPRCRRCKRPSR